MATKVLVPRLGEGVEEVTVTEWLKQVGDSVKELEPLLEVESDKVTVEVPAPASGVVLKIETQKGQSVKVGELLAVIGAEGENVFEESKVESAALNESKGQKPVELQPVTFDLHPSTDLGFISPVVAKVAAEHGVNLSQVKGTGLNGRITKNDVVSYVESQKGSKVETLSSQPVNLQSSNLALGTSPHDTLIKHSTIRKSIAAHMVESKHTSPHVLTVMEADMSHVVKHRAANKSAFEKEDVNLTFTAYFMTAIVSGLKAYPMVNSSWSDEGVLIHKNINIGMATSLAEEGLIVPVTKARKNLPFW